MANNTKTILVTGATGNLGGAVSRALVKRGFNVKAGTTSLGKKTVADGAKAVQAVFEDLSVMKAALEGTDSLFLISPPLDVQASAKLNPVIDLAKEAGVKHIVYISALGADQNEEAPLRIVERHLMASGVNYTILRPNFFMENFSTGFFAPMLAQGGIFLSAADGKTSFISIEDIAEVAATAFENELFGQELNITGPEALDHTEVAKIISEAGGKEIAYHAITEEEAMASALSSGMPESAAQYMAQLIAAVRDGWLAAVTDEVEEVTGKPATSFSEFAAKSAASWK